MREKPHRIRIVKFKGEELKQTSFLRRTTPISLCSAADSRTEQLIFYLSFDFHLQFTDKSVGASALCVLLTEAVNNITSYGAAIHAYNEESLKFSFVSSKVRYY